MPVDVEKFREIIDGPQGIGLGTNSKDLMPEYNRVLGASFKKDNHIEFYIAKATCGNALRNLDENGSIALVFANVMTFECYQFKGNFIRCYDGDTEAHNIVEQYMKRLDGALMKMGMGENITSLWPIKPVVAIEFEVKEVFDQTPKVGAGERIKSE